MLPADGTEKRRERHLQSSIRAIKKSKKRIKYYLVNSLTKSIAVF